MAASQHSLIFFVFEDDHVDDVAHPNKIILGRASPSVADVCTAVRSIFFTGIDVILSCSFIVEGAKVEFASDSEKLVPVDDRLNVISLRTTPSEGAGKHFSQAGIALTQWLASCRLEALSEPLLKNKVSLDLLKFIKDTDLLNMGIQDWEQRAALLDAIHARHQVDS